MKKIVLAEDEAPARLAISRMLQDMGYCCIACSTGSRALHVLDDNPDVSMLITDMVMPELNGDELIHLVRRRSQFKHMPILLLSGHVSYDEIASLLDMGATRFLAKPVSRAELRDSLAGLLITAQS